MPKLEIGERRKVITRLEEALKRSHSTPIWRDGHSTYVDERRKLMDQSVYLASLLSDELKIDYIVNWTEQIENGACNSWLIFHHFSKYIPADIVRPRSAAFFYKHPNKTLRIGEEEVEVGDRPQFQMCYDFLGEGDEEDAKAFVDDFADNGERFFSMFEGMDEKAKQQLSYLLQRVQKYKDDPLCLWFGF